METRYGGNYQVIKVMLNNNYKGGQDEKPEISNN